jgi:glycosyltransferase involved in cell wall biosynthesis
MKNKVFAIVPAYNEEENIVEVTSRIKNMGIMPVVVDDHSTDKTVDMAKSNGVDVVRQRRNMGKGHAMRAGLDYVIENYPDAEIIVFIDADMQYNPESTGKMLELLRTGEADFVTGRRKWGRVPFRHKLGNFVWRTAFNLLFGTKFKDTNCGLMALKRDAIEKIRDSITGGYIIENSMFIEAIKNGLKIKQVEVPVVYKKISRIRRGTRTVGGVLLFILREGIKYRLGIE